MIDLEIVEREINDIEVSKDTTYRTCERLAWLYVVRDHLRPTKADPRTQAMDGSEFLEACSGVSYPALMTILDEHMQTLAVVQPRVYDALMRKIRALP